MFMLIDTLRRIATDPIATADLWGPVVAPLVALVTITPMDGDGHDLADDARELLIEAFEAGSTPVEVGRGYLSTPDQA